MFVVRKCSLVVHLRKKGTWLWWTLTIYHVFAYEKYVCHFLVCFIHIHSHSWSRMCLYDFLCLMQCQPVMAAWLLLSWLHNWFPWVPDWKRCRVGLTTEGVSNNTFLNCSTHTSKKSKTQRSGFYYCSVTQPNLTGAHFPYFWFFLLLPLTFGAVVDFLQHLLTLSASSGPLLPTLFFPPVKMLPALSALQNLSKNNFSDS